jgi:hypothetical protein
MEAEKNKSRSLSREERELLPRDKIRDERLKSRILDTKLSLVSEVESIRLSPDQIEEIHTDEYSLTLFYATRMEPLSILEMKRQFPEPEPKKVQSVMDRYLKVGLVHVNPEGKYYSNFPENYINYSHYKYDSDLEARKDAKVFQVMKEQTGKFDFWKDKSYFSIDAFFSEEQSQELQSLFKEIRVKAKEFANQNAKSKSIRGLKFRRLKFFDMSFLFLFAVLFGMLGVENSFAGGNDPVGRASAKDQFGDFYVKAGGGNDPTAPLQINGDSAETNLDPGTIGGGGHDPCCKRDIIIGGGGHDPGNGPIVYGVTCVLRTNDGLTEMFSTRTCTVNEIRNLFQRCLAQQTDECELFNRDLEILDFHQ